MSFAAKNQTNPLVIDVTGYAPYLEKRLERAKSDPEQIKNREKAQAIQNYWIRERALVDIQDYVHHHNYDLFRSQWECSADKRGLYSRIKWEMDKLKAKRQEILLQRKERLKQLIMTEEKMYEMEEKGVKPSPETKVANMLERYTDIMIDKELERQKIAKAKQEQQFKNNCIELRQEVSKRICKLVTDEGKAIMNERVKQENEKIIEERMYAEAWSKDAEAKAQKEAEENALRKMRDLEYGEYVKGQMRNIVPKAEDWNQDSESQLMEEQMRLAKIEKEWEKAQKKMKQERQKKDLDRCLKNKLRRRAKEVQEDLMLDLYFLEQIIDAESEKRAAIEKKEKLHKEQEQYLQYLADQIKREEEYEKEVEKSFQEASDQMWERREKEWEADRKMREALNKKAIEECYKQIQTKMEKSRQVQEMRMQYAEEIKKQAAIDQKEAEIQEAEKRKKNIKNQAELLKQIQERNVESRMLKKKEQRECEKYKLAQEEYDKKVKEILASPHLDNLHPYRTTNLGT